MPHEKVPRILYEHPIVEYIPLEVTTIAQGQLPPPLTVADRLNTAPALMALNDKAAWDKARSDFAFAFDPAGLAGKTEPVPDVFLEVKRDLAFLAIGFEALAGIYRGRQVSLATSGSSIVYHLFSLTLKYFYKPAIDFFCFTPFGARLAEARNIPVELRAGRGRRNPGPR